MPTVARILEITPAAGYLASNDVAKSSIFNNGLIDPQLPVKIYFVYKILKGVYDADPTYDNLQKVANYLYELIRKYANKAAAITDGNTGGQVAPVTPGTGTLPVPYDFEVPLVATTDAPIADGVSSITFDGTNGTRDLRGYNVEFVRGSTPQYTTNPGDGSTYYGWNRVTGLFQLFNGAAILGERFRIFV